MSSPQQSCEGPLVWFDVEPDTDRPAAILECASCGWFITTGNFYDERHRNAPLLREGLTNR